jgi:hypothetical protein
MVRTTTSPVPAKNDSEPINIERKPLLLVGSIHDINRVMLACKQRLAFLEQSGDCEGIYNVYVRAPQIDEP